MKRCYCAEGAVARTGECEADGLGAGVFDEDARVGLGQGEGGYILEVVSRPVGFFVVRQSL